MRYKKQIALCIIILLGLLPFIFTGGKGPKEEPLIDNRMIVATPADLAAATPAQTDEPLTETEEQEEYVAASEEQLNLMEQLLSSMSRYQLNEAALLLYQNEDTLKQLYQEVLNETPCLYWDGTFSEEIEGKGLVLAKSGTLFYGEFRDGKPEGYVTAIQAVFLDQLRCDYSTGQWNQGKLEGMGEVGYAYVMEDQTIAYEQVRKSGFFAADLMTGEVEYQSSQQDQTYTWIIRVEEGLIVFDERWTFLEAEGKYLIPALEDPGYVYTINQEMSDKIQWKNMITWN